MDVSCSSWPTNSSGAAPAGTSPGAAFTWCWMTACRSTWGWSKLARQCSLAGEDAWSGIIRHHFTAMGSLRTDEAKRADLLADFEQVRSRLKLRLYPESYLAHAHICCGAFAPGFIVALVLDLPEALAVFKGGL